MLPACERRAFVKQVIRCRADEDAFFTLWQEIVGRDDQMPPAGGDWLVWLILAGRGFGKTRTGAETVRAEIAARRAFRVALVGPTAEATRAVMVEGQSGLLALYPPADRPLWEPSKHRLTWPGGAVATCYSADEPDRLRGPQHDFAWADELAAWRYPDRAWDMLMLGLRLGERPRAVVTTTPRPIGLIRALLAAPTTKVTRGSTHANAANLAPSFLTTILGRYEGTRLGRQEIDAELLEQADGALWTRAIVESARIDPADVPELARVVVAIDPAVTAGPGSDETGLIVAGLGIDGLAYVLRDASGRFSPDRWASRAIQLYGEHAADRVVAEINNGGDMVELTLRTVDPAVAYRSVHAAKGKRIRAEPVAALYEQGRVRHAGGFATLEDQMCNWDPVSGDPSPDRVDALVWAITDLALAPAATGFLDWYRAGAG